MKKTAVLLVVLAVLIGGIAFAGGAREERTADRQFQIAMVVKVEGVAWFDNMRLGIEAFDREHADVRAWQTGADTADPAAQVRIIEDLIAQGVDAILIVPNDPESLVPVIERARAQGIVVVTHEASNIRNADFDVEAFNNLEYGAHMASVMAEWMGGSGLWQPFVGHLTSTTHNEWVDGEIAYLQQNHPNIVKANRRLEENENQQVAYERSLEILRANPNIRAIMGSAMSTMPGAAQAIEELGLVGRVAAFGTCLPSVAGEYVESGAAESFHFWVPADAGYVSANVAYHLLTGREITAGVDLGRPGYNSITIQNNEHGVPVIYGQAWMSVNKDNLDEWRNPDGSWKL
ncbi:MAG: autoinducer 2 ABC transporter substrate-binding protein [Spirochaetaceae bacterium]|nr:MAG: autoinducer 2 ABC transporter substrate-binding protein [Spirochaetaceae bacterium]